MRTPGNFGKVGERPTHPELLDYLASYFIEGLVDQSDASVMMLSSTYQMSSLASPEASNTTPRTACCLAFRPAAGWKRFAMACWPWTAH